MRELTAEAIRDLVGESPTMLEIGCNDGEDSRKFLAAMPGIELWCFEPDPRAIARFREKTCDPRVTLTEAAIAAEDGAAVFHGSSGKVPERSRYKNGPPCLHLEEWDLSGSLQHPTRHMQYSPWVTFPKEREYIVSTMRLDTWFCQHPLPIAFAWIDAQGGEANIFRGGQNALRHTNYCYFEFYDNPLYEGQLPLKELLALLPDGESAWDFRGIYGENALVKNRRFQ